MTTSFTISHTIDQEIIDDLEVEFEDFRSRIAGLSVDACATLTNMYQPLGPADTEVIDIDAIEYEQFELTLVAADADETDATVYEFAAA